MPSIVKFSSPRLQIKIEEISNHTMWRSSTKYGWLLLKNDAVHGEVAIVTPANHDREHFQPLQIPELCQECEWFLLENDAVHWEVVIFPLRWRFSKSTSEKQDKCNWNHGGDLGGEQQQQLRFILQPPRRLLPHTKEAWGLNTHRLARDSCYRWPQSQSRILSAHTCPHLSSILWGFVHSSAPQ